MLKISDLSAKQRIQAQVSNETLRKNLIKAQTVIGNARFRMTQDLGNWEEWRDLTKQIRQHVIENLDAYLYQLSESVIRNGGHVFFAQTAQQARDYIRDICRQKQAKLVVKSKSMVTEEIGMNEGLQADGVRVVETDMGEFIIQIVNDKPSHIIAPAIHLNRTQVQQRLQKIFGYTGSDDIAEINAFVRKTIRADFLQADVGISGCNFAIPETGTCCLVTNEGNLRMATTVPKTHIAVMGMERMVPTFTDVDPVLTMLQRSAVGQPLAGYNTWLTGPRLAGEVDGPEEFHLVIVDNGRSKLLATEFQEALRCLRCAACLNICPAFRQIGGHGYGSIYSGPIGAMISPLLGGYEQFKELPNICSLCTACDSVCPARIPLSSLILQHRQQIAEQKLYPATERATLNAFNFLNSHPSLWEQLVLVGTHTLNWLSKDDGHAKWFDNVGVVKEWNNARDLPRNSNDVSFRSWFKQHQARKEA